MIRVLLALLLLLCNATAHAWGREGHRLIGELAAPQLTSAARTEVARLLAGEAEPTLAGASTWADEIRDAPMFRWTAPLHYVKFSDPTCRYSAARNCSDGLCVVAAIERYSEILADGRQPDSARREALKFLVHFVGDIHQPLHAGHRNDRGGNSFQVNIDGEGTNLHSVWDSRLLDSSAPGKPGAPADGTADRPRGNLSHTGAAEQWASESCLITEYDGFYPPRPGRLPSGYVQRFQALAHGRAALAADRLAATLNRLLTTVSELDS